MTTQHSLNTYNIELSILHLRFIILEWSEVNYVSVNSFLPIMSIQWSVTSLGEAARLKDSKYWPHLFSIQFNLLSVKPAIRTKIMYSPWYFALWSRNRNVCWWRNYPKPQPDLIQLKLCVHDTTNINSNYVFMILQTSTQTMCSWYYKHATN